MRYHYCVRIKGGDVTRIDKTYDAQCDCTLEDIFMEEGFMSCNVLANSKTEAAQHARELASSFDASTNYFERNI